MLTTFLSSNLWRTAAIGLGLALAVTTGVQGWKLRAARAALADRDATLRDIDLATTRAIATAQAQRAAAEQERDRVLASLPRVAAAAAKERRSYYAQNPSAAATVCLAADRVRAINDNISRMAAAAGIEPVPGEADPAAGTDR